MAVIETKCVTAHHLLAIDLFCDAEADSFFQITGKNTVIQTNANLQIIKKSEKRLISCLVAFRLFIVYEFLLISKIKICK